MPVRKSSFGEMPKPIFMIGTVVLIVIIGYFLYKKYTTSSGTTSSGTTSSDPPTLLGIYDIGKSNITSSGGRTISIKPGWEMGSSIKLPSNFKLNNGFFYASMDGSPSSGITGFATLKTLLKNIPDSQKYTYIGITYNQSIKLYYPFFGNVIPEKSSNITGISLGKTKPVVTGLDPAPGTVSTALYKISDIMNYNGSD